MRLVSRVALVAVIALLAGVVGLGWWLYGAAQPREGSLRLPGLKAAVTVARDDLGVPRITADSPEDAYFALGFVHAQDRLWQMEMQRRLGAGRLAELVGERALPVDKFMRTLGLYRLAEQSIAQLLPEVQQALQAYAAGVNAYLKTHSGPLPAEFLLLRASPEPWQPADSLVWGRLMALQLSGNWSEELLRAKLLQILPPDQVADLWPAYPTTAPVTVGLDGAFLDHMLAAIPRALQPQLASNVWVVSGQRSETGKPILANDPHLDFQAPILWYLVSISAPHLHLDGATVPGVPFHLLGHNRRIAWGITTTQSDTMDLFIEKAAGDGYLTPSGPAPFRTRNETIAVRGADPVSLTVRETRHGPVISDVLGERAEGQILALAAAALQPDDRTAQAIYRINRASDWATFTAALEDFHSPQQNLAYADVDGHIGFFSPGRVPIRKTGDGTLPRPGWTGEYDWTGWVPFEGLPHVYDPPSGMIVNANNKVVADDYPYLLAATWPEGYRAQRITRRLEEKPRHSVEDMAALQMDQVSLMVSDLKPLLLRYPPRGQQAAAVYDLLRAWNDDIDAARPEPLIFEIWLARLQQLILEPWLGPRAASFKAIRPLFLKTVLGGRSLWCAGPRQSPPPDCSEKVADALDRALADIGKRYGDDMSRWRWGDAHSAVFDPLFYRYVPLLGPMTRLSAAMGGDDFTIQRGSFAEVEPAVLHGLHGAGMRAVYDLAALDDSRFVIATGQSGNPLSRHWGDFLELWRRGASVSLAAEHPLPHIQVLEPAP